ncbi:hypothetical protein [Virgibacillus byunsanensis]
MLEEKAHFFQGRGELACKGAYAFVLAINGYFPFSLIMSNYQNYVTIIY